MKRRRRAGFPLLAKELAEQAARRRTYIVRILYAVLLFLIFAVFLRKEFKHTGVY